MGDQAPGSSTGSQRELQSHNPFWGYPESPEVLAPQHHPPPSSQRNTFKPEPKTAAGVFRQRWKEIKWLARVSRLLVVCQNPQPRACDIFWLLGMPERLQLPALPAPPDSSTPPEPLPTGEGYSQDTSPSCAPQIKDNIAALKLLFVWVFKNEQPYSCGGWEAEQSKQEEFCSIGSKAPGSSHHWFLSLVLQNCIELLQNSMCVSNTWDISCHL